MTLDITPAPEGEIVYDLYGGYLKPALLHLALTLDVFSSLKDLSHTRRWHLPAAPTLSAFTTCWIT